MSAMGVRERIITMLKLLTLPPLRDWLLWLGSTDLFADIDCPVLGHGGLSGVADVRVCSTAPCWWIRGVLLLAVVRVQLHGVSPQ